MNRKTKPVRGAYDAPSVQQIEIYPEQCFASSNLQHLDSNLQLLDMGANNVYDEEF